MKQLLAPATGTVSAKALGDLPEWNLDDLFPGRDSAELTAAIEQARARALAFEAAHKGKLSDLAAPALAAAIGDYEAIDETLGRMMSFASLLYAADMTEPESGRFYQTTQETVTEISTHLLFFSLEINKIDDADLAAKLADPALANYEPWLRDTRAFRPHQLDDDIEKLLLEKHVVGKAAWVRLFDESMAALRFKVTLPRGEQELTSAEIFNLMSDKDGAVRKTAAKSIGEVLGDNARIFTLITNTLAKDKEIDDKWRQFAQPVSSRNLSNFVEDEVVDALIAAVKAMYPALSHRYYALKASWFGGEQLDYWDRNAPLPDEDDRTIAWSDAVDTVLGAYGRFSPQLAELGQKFFDNSWIDAPVRPGKSPGAFAHPTVPSAHPYLLLNYQGKTRDVMTLAHELGHGVHQILAGVQGHLMSDTPLTLAETASVFGEMLTFRALLDIEKDAGARKALLAGKVEDMLNTVVRQIAFYEFERRIHDERRQGEILPERIGDIWLEVQRESLGPAFEFDEEYRHYWAYIPHFIHAPFYVYAYAFGDCLVNSLYAVYQDTETGFAEKYLDMLRAGGTKRHKELLAPFGLDASDADFWKKGLSMIAGFIDELEAMG
ncbi:MAG: M3 family oligoendopeptidase [Alphaproteobacteria bacterium]|nr:M3 family oligoendopeptidase [Alphaproteobacteria bacterium]